MKQIFFCKLAIPQQVSYKSFLLQMFPEIVAFFTIFYGNSRPNQKLYVRCGIRPTERGVGVQN
jgi:hypothetical protein